MEEQTFGEKVIKAREDAGFNQNVFAEKISVDRKTLAKWEKNLTFPNIEQIAKIADLSNKPIEYFIDGYLTDKAEDLDQKMYKKLQFQTNRNSELIEQIRSNTALFTKEMSNLAFIALYVVLMILSGLTGEPPVWRFCLRIGIIPSIVLIALCIYESRKRNSYYYLLLILPNLYFLCWNIKWTIRAFRINYGL